MLRKILYTTICLWGFTTLTAQIQPIVPDTYTWNQATPKKDNTGTSRLLFSGSGKVLALHTLQGITLAAGQSKNYAADAAGNERFFIIKEGPVLVKLAGKSYSINRGSVVFVLPGDPVSFRNSGKTTVALYEMNVRSKAASDGERGSKAGPSFVMDWKDMVVKPTEKGSTRQLFDRQTTMLNRFDIHVTQLNVGLSSHPPHTHTNEEIILMLEGNAEMQVGENKVKANGGDAVLYTSMIPHNLTNIGPTPCLYFAIQWN